MYLIFIGPQMSFPNDGMRFQENEQRFAIAAGNGRVYCSPTHKFVENWLITDAFRKSKWWKPSLVSFQDRENLSQTASGGNFD